ncbi:MAG: hypothetical protein WDN06_05900 [Asticcacaulis sp.]
MLGSMFPHGDQACHLWKSVMWAEMTDGGAAIANWRSSRKTSGLREAINITMATAPTTSTRMTMAMFMRQTPV